MTLLCGSLPSSQGKADGDEQKDKTQNPGMVWLGRDLRSSNSTPLAIGRDILQSMWEN